mmetsp:Transcript_6570/g.20385  ORF Transcript_6570/g.20385 Transcript_6570/m.20385 type:complete len:322 (+) Transcript_6570:74-1039(+)
MSQSVGIAAMCLLGCPHGTDSTLLSPPPTCPTHSVVLSVVLGARATRSGGPVDRNPRAPVDAVTQLHNGPQHIWHLVLQLRGVLHKEDGALVQQRAPAEQVEQLWVADEQVRRAHAHEIKRPTGERRRRERACQEVLRFACVHDRGPLERARRNVLPEHVPCHPRVHLDKVRLACAARQRLESDAASAGKEVEPPRGWRQAAHRARLRLHHVEDGLANLLHHRPRLCAGRRQQPRVGRAALHDAQLPVQPRVGARALGGARPQPLRLRQRRALVCHQLLHFVRLEHARQETLLLVQVGRRRARRPAPRDCDTQVLVDAARL